MNRSRDDGASSGANPFDWDDFRSRFFGEGWKEAGWNGGTGSIPFVDRYVRDVLAEVVPDAFNRTAQEPVRPSRVTSTASTVFETHRMIIVRIRLTPAVDPTAIRLFAGTTELWVTGLPEGEEKAVKLPMPVRAEAAKAVCKNRILEISLPKEEETPPKEIPIRHMGDGR